MAKIRHTFQMKPQAAGNVTTIRHGQPITSVRVIFNPLRGQRRLNTHTLCDAVADSEVSVNTVTVYLNRPAQTA